MVVLRLPFCGRVLAALCLMLACPRESCLIPAGAARSPCDPILPGILPARTSLGRSAWPVYALRKAELWKETEGILSSTRWENRKTGKSSITYKARHQFSHSTAVGRLKAEKTRGRKKQRTANSEHNHRIDRHLAPLQFLKQPCRQRLRASRLLERRR